MKRFLSILGNTARSVIGPLYSVVLSICVVKLSDSSVWGYFVESLIVIGILSQFLNWGFKEFLLRSFSQSPARTLSLFMENLLSRALLLPVATLLLFLYADGLSVACWLSGWLILSFCYQSLEVFVIYKKSFTQQLLAETLGFSVTLAGLYGSHVSPLDYEIILHWFTMGMGVKLIFLFVFLRKEFSAGIQLKADRSFFKKGMPFFLIGLSGTLISKADLYIVGIFSPPGELGIYQVITTLFVYLQAMAGFAVTPFMKSLYRISPEGYRAFSRKFRWLGLLTCLLAMPFIYLLIDLLYQFELTGDFYVYGFLMTVPVFIYLPVVLSLFRQGMEKRVMWVNFSAAGLSALLTYLLIPVMGIKGGLLATAITQWLLVAIYFFPAMAQELRTENNRS